jgi:hypothetical protein
MKKILLALSLIMISESPLLFAKGSEYKVWISTRIPNLKSSLSHLIPIDRTTINNLDKNTKDKLFGLCYVKNNNVELLNAHMKTALSIAKSLKDLKNDLPLTSKEGVDKFNDAVDEIVNCDEIIENIQ